MNQHTGKELEKLNGELQELQEQMMGKARGIEIRLGVIKMLEECEVNGHHWELLEQPKHNLFELDGSVLLRCTKCRSDANSDSKKVYLTFNEIGDDTTVEEFINGSEEE